MNREIKLTDLTFPVKVAHRGYNVEYPENTMSAFRAALEKGAAAVEFDVSFSRDRKLVIIHDETLERTTNGHGRINELSLAELRKLDAGSWFDPRFSGEKIPVLEEVLDLAGHKVVLNIEIKEEYLEKEGTEDAIELQVLRLVKSRDLLSSTIISSFEIEYLERLSKLPHIPRLAFISRHPATEEVVDRCKKLNLFSWNGLHEIITRKQVERLHRENIKVFAFTVNDPADYKRLLEIGVDGFFSDDFVRLSGGHQ